MFRVRKESFYAAHFKGYEIEKLYISVADCPNRKTIITKDFETEKEAKLFYEKEKESIIETKPNKDFNNHFDGEIIELIEIQENDILLGMEDLIDSFLKCKFAIN